MRVQDLELCLGSGIRGTGTFRVGLRVPSRLLDDVLGFRGFWMQGFGGDLLSLDVQGLSALQVALKV